MSEIKALDQAVMLNRSAFFNRIREAQTAIDRRQEQQVKIISFDTSLAGFNVKHPDGTLGFAKAISNSSNLYKGAYVSLIRPAGTQTAIIDTTPRG
ncbi:hypothetical protein COO91_03474 [Nostoc flagelliforme CCNUN1]|uniref:Uncharacterized protein n=1 Tax=Nostoc flagelliforme CCNUN1 TaxID=2038116 RepID=A0A2K8SPZ3_9NOSO|nr:hypothetical protein [Nostoc flagelliforme]AUB37529.1 hypothetical protein COO91_03474 [Nostoc flagelliforme CCNUN1]